MAIRVRGAIERRRSLEDVKELSLTEDPSLGENGCVVESRYGDVDIGVETQFEATARVLVRAED